MRLDLVGPLLDAAYFATEIAPQLDDRIRYLGHLDSAALARRVGSSAVTLVTPEWDEPYGLVAAESMATGTPVAAFTRGGLPELISSESGRLCSPGDIEGLAGAMIEASALSRERTRAHAVRHCSIQTMVDGYEHAYSAAAPTARAW
jgi:glycosyltransferase involved in cell wall biosynthesis